MAKTIADPIVFAAKPDVWRQMSPGIICAMLIAMNIWQNSKAFLLSRKAARRNAFRRFATQ